MMKEIYADLHIHIGRTQTGRTVKITGSKNLTLQTILETATPLKYSQKSSNSFVKDGPLSSRLVGCAMQIQH